MKLDRLLRPDLSKNCARVIARLGCDPRHIPAGTGTGAVPLQFACQAALPRDTTRALHRMDPMQLESERRRALDRRSRTLRALVHGSLTPRRRGPRRGSDRDLAAVDWHHPQWLAVSLLILIFSFADAILTITLLQRGAYEANPIMAHLLNGSGWGFAVAKIGLTAGGVVLLTLMAHMRVFGRLPVSVVLYGLLTAYAVLIGYEAWLLDKIGFFF